MNHCLRRWLRISIFNLLLVALAGVLMRYKIAYSLPFINQQYFLHAHSHFAFAGWVTQALMSLMVFFLYEAGNIVAFRRYKWILYANLFAAYGMLLTFPFFGYASLSIVFSTLSIVVSYCFAVQFWKDLNLLPQNRAVHGWFKAAVLFNVLSSLGAFSLAFMLATKTIQTERYLASVYFFLHFQYNGWFFFACMGLFAHQLYRYRAPEIKLRRAFILFAASCVPAFFLSALWMPIPKWLYGMVILAVILQLAGWVLIWQLVKGCWTEMRRGMAKLPQYLFLLCALALTIKLSLQSASVIPSLSKLAFGFRPIVIGYLHLVLLGVITLFILSYCIGFRLVPVNKATAGGVIVFTAGIIVNEILLMMQGVQDLNYQSVPYINEMLFAAALIMLAGIGMINYGQRFTGHDRHKIRENN